MERYSPASIFTSYCLSRGAGDSRAVENTGKLPEQSMKASGSSFAMEDWRREKREETERGTRYEGLQTACKRRQVQDRLVAVIPDNPALHPYK